MNDSPDKISIALIGDVMLDRAVGNHYRDKPNDFKLEEIAKILRNYDVVLANLENPVGTGGAPHPKQDPNVAFRCHPDTLKILKDIGVNIVTLANNHMLDYGEHTLLDTLTHVDNAGLMRLGAGKNYQEANKPLTLTIKNLKLAFIGSVFLYSASTERATYRSPGVADYRIRKILAQITDLKMQGYTIIVTLHWGMEYSFFPLPYQVKQARAMVDAGASLILGHGPHYPQGIETYKNADIVYSVGNFIFDEPYVFSKRGFIYGTEMNSNSKLSNRRIYPFKIVNHCPVLEPKGENSRLGIFIQALDEICSRKNKAFWKNINNIYFQDVMKRVFRMKSFKFVLLPPVSFYFSIGIKNMLKKFNLKNFIRHNNKKSS